MSSREPPKPSNKTQSPKSLTGRPSVHKGARINHIMLPDLINCSICSMARPTSSYSEAQLKQLRVRIYKNGAQPLDGLTLAKCDNCTLTPSDQRMCKSCGRFKKLNEFSKTQRFDGELYCVQCADWNQQFEHRNDENELTEGHHRMPALTMEPAGRKELADVAQGAGPSSQAMILHSNRKPLKTPIVGQSSARLMCAIATIHDGTVQAKRAQYSNDSSPEGDDLDTVAYL